MPGKDLAGFLAVVGVQLKREALEYKRQQKADSPFDEGLLMGYAFALDAIWDQLPAFGLEPSDLKWTDFVPERDLLGVGGRAGRARAKGEKPR